MSSVSTDVPQLVKRCLEGDEVAMQSLLDRYKGQVFGLCFRMLGHRQDAEDMAQETFVRVFRSLHSWDCSRDFEPWLLAIAGNRCRSALARRSKRPRSQELPELTDVAHDEASAARHLSEEIQRALSQLRDEYRQAFVLYHQHALAYAEIAESMECPVGTVKTWVHRARRELVEQLKQRDVIQEPQNAVRDL